MFVTLPPYPCWLVCGVSFVRDTGDLVINGRLRKRRQETENRRQRRKETRPMVFRAIYKKKKKNAIWKTDRGMVKVGVRRIRRKGMLLRG